jgi:hypothetical protein
MSCGALIGCISFQFCIEGVAGIIYVGIQTARLFRRTTAKRVHDLLYREGRLGHARPIVKDALFARMITVDKRGPLPQRALNTLVDLFKISDVRSVTHGRVGDRRPREHPGVRARSKHDPVSHSYKESPATSTLRSKVGGSYFTSVRYHDLTTLQIASRP